MNIDCLVNDFSASLFRVFSCFILGVDVMACRSEGCLNSCVGSCQGLVNRFKQSQPREYSAHSKVSVTTYQCLTSPEVVGEGKDSKSSGRDIEKREVAVASDMGERASLKEVAKKHDDKGGAVKKRRAADGEGQGVHGRASCDIVAPVVSEVNMPSSTRELKVDHYLMKRGKLIHVLDDLIYDRYTLAPVKDRAKKLKNIVHKLPISVFNALNERLESWQYDNIFNNVFTGGLLKEALECSAQRVIEVCSKAVNKKLQGKIDAFFSNMKQMPEVLYINYLKYVDPDATLAKSRLPDKYALCVPMAAIKENISYYFWQFFGGWIGFILALYFAYWASTTDFDHEETRGVAHMEPGDFSQTFVRLVGQAYVHSGLNICEAAWEIARNSSAVTAWGGGEEPGFATNVEVLEKEDKQLNALFSLLIPTLLKFEVVEYVGMAIVMVFVNLALKVINLSGAVHGPASRREHASGKEVAGKAVADKSDSDESEDEEIETGSSPSDRPGSSVEGVRQRSIVSASIAVESEDQGVSGVSCKTVSVDVEREEEHPLMTAESTTASKVATPVAVAPDHAPLASEEDDLSLA